MRTLEFFTANISNDHTRKAYANAARRFSLWCESMAMQLPDVKPVHVAAFIKQVEQQYSIPTAKLHLAALRHLFDWLVTGQIMPTNPAHSVRGPKHVVKRGKTPVLTADEARALLISIDGGTIKDLRDRALIATMIYTFARVGAVIKMQMADYYLQEGKKWVRLHEKGGKEHEVPVSFKLQKFLEDYISAAGIAAEPHAPLFRSMPGGKGEITGNPLRQKDVYDMINRRARTAGIQTKIGCHTFRATGITAYLKNGGTLETAQQIANHSSPRTTKLYDRRSETISLDEVERIAV
jgi:site-specific recombinase XerD